MSMPAQRRDYILVQVLRGLAALMVVSHHCLTRLAEKAGTPGAVYMNGSSGVDIFFIISGFVMAVSSQKLQDIPGGWRVFLERRLIRIVPLYWLLTTIKLVLVRLSPQAALHANFGWANIVSSYLFLPSINREGQFRAVLPVAWTLSFEMLFYVLFALALGLRLRVVPFLSVVLGGLTVVAFVRTDDWPIVTALISDLPLEFLYGVIIGTLTLRGAAMKGWWPVVMGLGAVAAILTLPIGPILGAAQNIQPVTPRVLSWGLPAALIVASAVSLEDRWGGRMPRWLTLIGDASYSIYLVHGMVLPGVEAAVNRLHLGESANRVAVIALGVVCSAVAGCVLYKVFEYPVTRRLKKLAAAG